MKHEILVQTAREYFYAGRDEYLKERFNAAVVLFFKSVVALTDLYILQHTGKSPSSHSARFAITQQHFPEVYDLLDKDFPFYQDSYIHIMTKELAEVIRNDAISMAQKTSVNFE